MGTRIQCNRLAISKYKETAYGTAVADGNIDIWIELNEPALLDVSQEAVDNAAFIKGHEFPEGTDKEILVSQDIDISFSFVSSL